MPRLIAAKPAPQAQFVLSLPLSLMSTMSLICAAPHFEGLDAWLSETRQRLDPAFLHELSLVLGFAGRFQRFTEQVYIAQLMEDPALSYEAFMDRLRALPEKTFVAIAHRAIARGVKPPLPPDAVPTLLKDPTALKAHLCQADLNIDVETVLAFLQNLPQIKSRFVAVVERFWREVYQAEWLATLPLMERSVAYHLRQRYRLDFPDLFMAVTGRLLPQVRTDLSAEEVCFVPSCYIGPYFAYMSHPRALVVYYNCRATPVAQRQSEGPGLFPLLKALADETRLQIVEMLQGQEMYARQIVERLDISQAAVSRHLKLMTRAGVLCVRREGGAKFYSIDTNTLNYLLDTLRELGG
jgi:DNA-binding transcriptional ArsR family regulator